MSIKDGVLNVQTRVWGKRDTKSQRAILGKAKTQPQYEAAFSKLYSEEIDVASEEESQEVTDSAENTK